MMKILILSATPFEIEPTRIYLKNNFEQVAEGQFIKGNAEINLLISGVGLTHTAYNLTKAIARQSYNLLINAGIDGAINRWLDIGEVVQVVAEEFGDLGVEEADGRFSSVMDLDLIDGSKFPFSRGKLLNTAADAFQFLPKVKGISVNKVHGTSDSIKKLLAKTDAEIESMESAAFFYVALMEGLPFLSIRSISNYVEPRNKENWDIPLAIENLNKVIIEILGFFMMNTML